MPVQLHTRALHAPKVHCCQGHPTTSIRRSRPPSPTTRSHGLKWPCAPRGAYVFICLIILSADCLWVHDRPHGVGVRIGEAATPGPAPATFRIDIDDAEGEAVLESDDDCWPCPPAGDADTDQAAFVASSSFLGGRPGFVFKKGAYGLGYYRDAPVSLSASSARPLASVTPVTLELSRLLTHQEARPFADASTLPAGFVRNKVRQLERQLRTNAAASPEHCPRRCGGLSCWHGHAPNAAEAAAAAFKSSILTAASPQIGASCVHPSSRVHAQVGLWAIDTVNANAWPNFAS